MAQDCNKLQRNRNKQKLKKETCRGKGDNSIVENRYIRDNVTVTEIKEMNEKQ